MKYTIYEDPITHQFAHAPLPSRFLEGDPVPAVVTDRWFVTHDAAVAALSELLDRETADAEPVIGDVAREDAAQTQTASRPIVWLQH